MAAIWPKSTASSRRRNPPVGVGDEVHRRVEGEHRLHAGEVLRIERQMILKHQDQENGPFL